MRVVAVVAVAVGVLGAVSVLGDSRDAPKEEAIKVERKDGRVWIAGVPRLAWGKSRDNTYTGAVQAALAGMGEKHSYDELMVYSGLAFRLRWGRAVDGQSWSGSAPIGELSDVDYTPITGWRLRWDGDIGKHRDKSVAEIVASIDAGKAVLGYVQSDWDMGLVYGY